MKKEYLLFCCLFLSFFIISAQTVKTDVDSLLFLLQSKNIPAADKMHTFESLGHAYESAYQAENAANAYKEAVDICRALKNKEKLTGLLYQYAVMSTYAGDYEKAVTALDEILTRHQTEQPNELYARALMQLGLVNFFQQKWTEALYFYQQALKIAEKLNNKEGISIAYNNIANIHQKKGERKQALNFYGKALKIQRQLADSSAMCNCLMNIASNYLEQGDVMSAKKPLNEALDIAQKIGDNEITALCYMHFGVLYSKDGNWEKSENMLREGEQLAKQGGYSQVRQEILHTLSNVYEDAGNYQQSLKYLKQAEALSDSLMAQQMMGKTREFETRYKTQEKEKELELHTQSLKTARLLYILFSVVMLLLTMVIAYLIYNAKQRKKRNKQLAELNTTKDKLFSIISHDLKSPVIAQKMAIEAMMEELDKYDERMLQRLKAFHDASESQLSLLQNLLNWASLQTRRMEYTPIVFNVSDLVSKAVDLYSISAQNKNLQLITEISPECLIRGDKQMISTVIRNLLNNAIKFSLPGNDIKITVSCNEQGARISISDKGVGMSHQQIDDLFKQGKNTSKEDTRGEKISGLGLIICKELLEKNNSCLHIDSKENEGSTISFNILKG